MVIIVALCISGHLSEVIVNVLNIVIQLFHGSEIKPLPHEQNFTVFAFALSCIIIIYDILALANDFIFTRDWKELKKTMFTLTPKNKNRTFFNLFPIRLQYFVMDTIALNFWRNFFISMLNKDKNFHFVEYFSIIIIIYFFLILYRLVAHFKYEYE